MKDKVSEIMRLEKTATEVRTDDSHFDIETSHGLFEKSWLGPPPLLHASCIGKHKNRDKFKCSTIFPVISRDLPSADLAEHSDSEKPATSTVIKRNSAVPDSSTRTLDVTSESCKSLCFKRHHSCASPEKKSSPCCFSSNIGCANNCSGEKLIKVKNANLSDTPQKTESKNSCAEPSSMSVGERVRDPEMRVKETAFCRDGADINVKDCSGSCPSGMLPHPAMSASGYPHQRQHKLLKQNAICMPQDCPFKPDLSEGTRTFDLSVSEAEISPQFRRSPTALSNCFNSDYNFFRYQQLLETTDLHRLRHSSRSLDAPYLSGLENNSHDDLFPRGRSAGNTPSISRRKSSPNRLELDTAVPYSGWSNAGDVYKQRFQSLSNNDRQNRFQRGHALHMAYRRALSDYVVPVEYIRDFCTFKRRSEDDGSLEDSLTSEDDIMNLSNTHGHNNSVTLNGKAGSIERNSSDSAGPPSSLTAKSSPVLVGAAKRKSKPSMDPAAMPMSAAAAAHSQQQNLLMMAAQQGLTQQQLQHSLQQQGLPPSLQQVMQQQTMAMQQAQHQKLHEQLLHFLNEQLQMNLMHQANLMKDPTGKSNKALGSSMNNQSLQALLMQHQQIMQQIQLVQRQFALASVLQPFGMHQGMMSPAELQQLWKEVSQQSGIDDNILKVNGLPSSGNSHGSINFTACNGPSTKLSNLSHYLNGDLDGYSLSGVKSDPGAASMHGSSSSSTSSSKDMVSNGTCSAPSHPLYINKCCKWPNCEAHLEEFQSFIKHLNTEHQLDDRSTAQSRVQMEVVSSLESQLAFQKKVLKAMTDHLHRQSLIPSSAAPASQSQPASSSLSSMAQQASVISSPSISQLSPKISHELKPENLMSQILPKPSLLNPGMFSGFLPPVSVVPSPIMPMTPIHRPPPLVSTPSLPPTPTMDGPSSRAGSDGGGPVRRRVSDKCNLPISAEIQRNREFYKNTDVRPPFTYASLIRQAIIESPHRQLTLNEIYQWFQNTFAYFRRNEATWKNAVRHNLSLHKCFMRVENVKGAVWTVDEIEFYKRRPQKLGAGPGSMKNSSMSDPSSYNETISASLRAALGDGIGMLGAGILPDQESAQDLSMKASVHEVFGPGGFDEAELMMRIKQEVQEVYPDLDFSNPRPASHRQSSSSPPQHEEQDPKGVEVKGGQMVMMPDVIDHYDNREEMDEHEEERRMEEDTEERSAEIEKCTSETRKDSVDCEEESDRGYEERQNFEVGGGDNCSVDESQIETEAERELRAVQEKFEQEQAEDLRREYSSVFENGYKSTGEKGYNRQHHYMSVPTSFSPLNAPPHEEDRRRHCSDDHHFLGRSVSDEYGEERPSSKHGGSNSPFIFAPEDKRNRNQKDAASHKEDSSATRPFVVQLPDSGPVFPTPHRQSMTARTPPADTAISGTS